MTNQFQIKEGDTRPTLDYTLQRNGSIIDLRNADYVSLKVEDPENNAVYINVEASIVDSANGKVSYTLADNDHLPIGEYQAEFKIHWTDGGTQTVPHDGYIQIEVNRPIGDVDPGEVDDPDITVTTVYTDNIAANSGTEITLRDIINADLNTITGLPDPTADSDAAHKAYVDTHTSDTNNPHNTTLEEARTAGNTLAGSVDAGGNDFNNVGALHTGQINSDWYLTTTPQDIADAVTAINDNGGGMILLPYTGTGTPLDVSGLSLPLDITTDDVKIVGYGPEATRIDTGDSPLFRCDSDVYWHTDFNGFRIDKGSATGGLILDHWHGECKRVFVNGTGGVGFECTGIYSATFDLCRSKGNVVNWRVRKSTTGNSRLTIQNTISSQATGPASVVLDNSGTDGGIDTPKILNCLFIDNEKRALTIKGARNPVISDGCRFETNDQSDSGVPDINLTTDDGGTVVWDGVIRDCEFVGLPSGSTTNVDFAIQANSSRASGEEHGLKVEGNLFRDYATRAIDITTTAEDVYIGENSYDGVAAKYNPENGVRCVANGLGYNAGDPSAGGDWNTNGYEGVVIRDTTNANTYLYNNGTWSQIASA